MNCRLHTAGLDVARRARSGLLLAVLLVGWSSAAAVRAEEPNKRPSDTSSASRDPRATDFLIGPEDILDIQVWKNPELSRTVPVRPDGKVSLPLVNDIQAAGLTPTDLRDQVTTRLAEFVPSPEVSVIVREVHSVKVAVIGAVKIPGRYEVKSPATVLELIAQAQGLTEFASRDRIVVIRQNGTATTRVPFNYRKVADGSDQDNFFVRAGDIILVP
jgi:polysaccharide export outer membrane protein